MRLASQKINLCNTPAWVRAAYPGIWPSLSLAGHFDQGLYWAKGVGQCSPDAIFACTRGSTKYVTTASGLLVPIPINGLPIGAGNGNLVEQAATNLALQSQTLDSATWVKTTCTVGANSATAPDGTLTADSNVPNNGSNGNAIGQANLTVVASSVYTYSRHFKYNAALGLPWVELTTTGDATRRGWFNTQTGAIGTVSDYTSATTTALANGWFRFTVTFTAASSTSETIYASSRPSNGSFGSVTGDGVTPAYYDWGVQFELGSTASSYIPTTTVAVTRAADSIVPAGTAANAFKPAAISIFVQSNNVASFSGFPRYIGYSNGHSPLQITNNTKTSTYNGSVELDATLGSGTVTGGTVKTAVGYDGTGRSIVANNGTVATDANVEALGANTVFIGAQSAGGQFLNGYMARLAVFGGRLSDAQLKALTQ